MPTFLTLLGVVGTAAMVWVGGGISVHGLEVYGVPSVGRAIDSVAEVTAHALPSATRAVKWTVVTFLSAAVGLLVGAVSIPVVGFACAPVWRLFKAYSGAKSRDRGSPATIVNSPVSPTHDD
jgi:predicted DNA repair protein MutK